MRGRALAVAWSGGGGRGLSDTVAVTVAGKDGEGPRVLHIPRGGFGVGVGKATMGYLSDRRKQGGRWRAGGVEQFEYIQNAGAEGRELRVAGGGRGCSPGEMAASRRATPAEKE